MNHSNLIARIAVAPCLCSPVLVWATPASGVLELFNRLPDPPATAEEAVRWIPGCDRACESGWQAYAAKMLPLMIARNTSRIVGYDEGMLGEIGLLVAKTEEIALRASRTVHCGSQAVAVPQALCL